MTTTRTPGMEALAEAMRLEQARIYGQVQREHQQPVEATAEARVYQLDAARRRRSA